MLVQEVYLAYPVFARPPPPVHAYHLLRSSLRKNGKGAVPGPLMLFWAGEKGRKLGYTSH